MDNEQVSELIRRQYGVISRQQALGCGMSPRQVGHRLATGEWEQVARGVYRHRLSPASWRGRLLAACLRFDAVASHRAAAALHRIEGFAPGFVDITVPHGDWRADPRVVLHQSTQIDRIEEVSIDGIRCTGLARTVLDVAVAVDRGRLDAGIDGLLREGRMTYADLWSVLIRHSRQGRDGCGRLREALEDRRGEGRVPLSSWSRLVAQLLVEDNLPTPTFEHRVLDGGGGFVAQVDLAYPARRVAIELDSVSWHLNRAAFVRDRQRRNRLTVAGWTVLEFTWADFAEQPGALCATVRRALTAGFRGDFSTSGV